MNEDKRPPPSPKRPRWSRGILTTDREEASRTSRAASATVSSCSSIQPVLSDVPSDAATNAAEPVGRHSNQGARHHDSRPLFDEAQSLLSHSMSFELGFEDLGCYYDDDDDAEPQPKISATIRGPSAAPSLQYPPPGLAADMGDSPCLVALTSQQRHYKTSRHPVLQARDNEFLGSRSREGGTSQARTGAPELQGDPAVPDGPSVEVILGRKILPIDRQPLSIYQAMPALSGQRKPSIPFSGLNAAERAWPSVASTGTRKPPAAGAKGEAAPAVERQSLKIDISFGKPAGPDKDGKLLKSISTNVEKIVARLLTRQTEDRRPLSRADNTERAMIKLDSQQCISVDVTMTEDAGERRQTLAYPAGSAGQATSKYGLSATPLGATTTPAGTSTDPAERRRPDGPRSPPTPTSVVHLTIGPISFGHSQPAIQHVSQPESVQKAKRRKASADNLSTSTTPSEMAREAAAFRGLKKSLPPAAGSANKQAEPPAEEKHLPLAPTSTDKLLKQPKKEQLPQALASPGEPLKPAKESQLSSGKQLKPAKESDVTSLSAVDEDRAVKKDAESVRKRRSVSAKRQSEGSLPSVHEMSAICVSDKVRKRSADSGSTEMRRPSGRMSMSKDGAPYASVKATTKESAELSPETGEMLTGRKRSIGGKKAPKARAKETPVKPPVSSEETLLPQKTNRAKPADEALRESQVSYPESGKVASKRKKSDARQKPATTASSKKRKKSLKSPDKADIGIEKSPKEPSQVKSQPEPSVASVPISPENKNVSSDDLPAEKGRRESAAPEGTKSQEAPANTPPKASATEIATKKPDKAALKSNVHGDRERTKMLSEELVSTKGDQHTRASQEAPANTPPKASATEIATKKPDKAALKSNVHGDRERTKMLSEELVSTKGDQHTRASDTSLHSILKRHHRSKTSKKPKKATKDAAEEAAEKHSKAAEDTKASVGSGRLASRHEEAKYEGSPHELDKPTTTKTAESETGEPVSKSSLKSRKSLAIDAPASEQKDPDTVAIERARRQSVIRTEHSELDEKDLDDFLIGFELALSPYRVLVGLKPPASSQDEEGASQKGAKRSKGRKPHKKGRRMSIVRIHKTDIERKKKKGHSGVESPSPLALLAPESAVDEQTADTGRKGKRKRSKDASSKLAKARKSAATAEETGASATATTGSPTTRDSRRKTSATSRGSVEGKGASVTGRDEFQRDSQPMLKERSGPEGERLPADEAGAEPGDREFLEEDEEDEERRKKKKKKKKKNKGGDKRKPKKRKRKRKKRNRPFGYRSGRPTCRILCPIVVGLLLAVILLFLLLRALATASTATFPTTTTYLTFTYPTPRSTPTASTPRTVPPPVPPALPPTPPPAVPTRPPPVVRPTIAPPPPGSDVYVCPTEVCRHEAAHLANLLNTVDSKPCDNLLAYVCDAWSRDNPAGPEGVGSFVSRGTMIQDALAQTLIEVIRSTHGKDFEVAALLYGSCAWRPETESALAFAQDMFRTWVIKAWPRNASAKARTSDVWQFAAEVFRDLGISALLEVTIGVSPKGVRQTVVELDRPQLLFYRSDEPSAEVDTLLRGAVEEALAVFTQSTSPEVVDQTKRMFVGLARLPDDGQPDTSGTPERWILVEFHKLDGGLQKFLGKLFDNIVHPGEEPDVILKSPTYVHEGLVHFVKNSDPVQALNYMGFLVVVRLAPFFPDRMRYVRGLFAKSMLGRSLRDVTNSSKLCLLAVESLLPDCFAKAAALIRERSGAELGVRDVLSRLKTLFGREVQHLAWLGELSALFVRYNLRKNRVIRFGRPRPGSCVQWRGNDQDLALKRYFHISLMRQQEKLQAVLNYSAAANALAFESELDTEVRYDPSRRVVHVPAVIMNPLTRTNDSFFALHLPRVATRLYRAMVKMLTEEEPYGGLHTLTPGLTENSAQALRSLLGCIENNLDRERGIEPYKKTLRKAVLEQAVAIHLAFRAFREMLHVRRIWNLDYRLPNLNLTSDQLFFLYFALDNCNTADSVYRRRQPRAAEDIYRVHMPLRYLQEFSDAFQCNRQPVCKIFL
ncbi:uncharacterized protein LOC142589885 [Dermacentor variabilis]|uniref:uncharacterized protein LOC142589885 n=1 Tax=Dermacentor variabilis TaxID=34621 RepID=UPI003F5BD0BD